MCGDGVHPSFTRSLSAALCSLSFPPARALLALSNPQARTSEVLVLNDAISAWNVDGSTPTRWPKANSGSATPRKRRGGSEGGAPSKVAPTKPKWAVMFGWRASVAS